MTSISIIIPAFNAAKHICSALDSIACQTLQPTQIIIVDDGSRDNTVERVTDWSETSNIRLNLVRKLNGGAASARNVGFEHAEGELVAFLDADDLMHPSHLETLAAPFNKHPGIVLAFGITEARDDAGELVRIFPDQRAYAATCWQDSTGTRLLGSSAYSSLLEGSYICTCASLMSRRAAESIQYLDETLLTSEDRDFWLRLSRIGTFAFQPKLIATYRLHDENTTHPKHRLRHLRDQLRVLNKMSQQADELNLDITERKRTLEATQSCISEMLECGSRNGVRGWLTICRDLYRFGHTKEIASARNWVRAVAYSTVLQSD